MLPKRLYNLDVARGFAALSVVIWHWQSFFFDSYELPANFSRASQPLYNILRIFYEKGGHLAVSFFFILSGFVFFWLYNQIIAEGKCSFRKFAVLRFARLYPLHLATLMLVTCLQAVYYLKCNEFFVYPHNDPYHFVLQTLFISNWGFESGFSFNAPVWSVSIEVGLYAIFFVFAYMGGNTWMKLLGMVFLSNLLFHLGIGGKWTPAIMAFFMGGVTYQLISMYCRVRSGTADICVVIVALVLWAAAALSGRKGQLLIEHYQLHLLILYPMTVASLVLAEINFPKAGLRLAWLGDISYSTYLLHFPLQLVFILGSMALGYENSVFLSPVVFIAFFAVLISVSLLSFHLFERPMQSQLRRLILPTKAFVPSMA